MTSTVRIALPKGRLFDSAVALLAKSGITIGNDQIESRKLIFRDETSTYEFVSLKPVDIPVYVESGSIDTGIVGSDVLRELGCDVDEPLDLQIGKCRLVVAAPGDSTFSLERHPRIATKYPRTTEQFFRGRNAHVHIVRLDGSVEIAPLLGLADAIVDLVETGRTLRENGMRVVEEVAAVSARLIVNRTAMKVRAKDIHRLISQLDATVYADH